MADQLIKCPTCGSTGRRCVRPSGHEAQHWHTARENAKARECMCEEVCVPWLEEHATEQLVLAGAVQPETRRPPMPDHTIRRNRSIR